MSNPSHIRHAVLARLAAVLLLSIGLLAASAAGGGPLGPQEATAACKGSSKAAKRIGLKRATSATICLINKQRSKAGLRKLERSKPLGKAARSHVRRMKRTRCYAHTCPGGPSLSGRLQRAGYLPCNCTYGAGETINVGQRKGSSPRTIVKQWMASGSHRASILRSEFEHVGAAVRLGSPSEPGERRAATYVVDLGFKR